MTGALRWLTGFFSLRAPQSMTRLVSLILALAAARIACKAPGEWQTVTALVGGGCVALLRRSQPKDAPVDTPSTAPGGADA